MNDTLIQFLLYSGMGLLIAGSVYLIVEYIKMQREIYNSESHDE